MLTRPRPTSGPRYQRDHRLSRAAVAVPVLSLLVLPLATGTAAAAPGGERPDRPVRASYSNPLAPVVSGDGTVDSCADPTVLRSQRPEDEHWYMWCTTDPLNDEDRDAGGNLVFNKIPQLRSTDLVTWEYVGNAFIDNPSWAPKTASLWAPDVVYSSSFDQYYMFVTVTDTKAPVGSLDEACTGDSAIGVATSRSATGPWVFSNTPVVAPRARSGGDAGCDYLWTFDPDVLGDTVADTSTLYYGSYNGGMFAAPLTLTRTGATAATADATQVTIANRYEGANVLEKDGYFYLFASAANCCNGALTGYSVFAGRSTSPLGPFVDREGVSLLANEVGGTPVISMNGNRWVGTGHNSVFQDESGQWWTAYHAVDQQDPFFETVTGFTKRPVLLDGIDIVDGWPTVNGGRGASDRQVPAPAGQPGEISSHDARPVKTATPDRLLPEFSDEFSGPTLDDAWSWEWAGDEEAQDPPPAPTYSVSDGVLKVAVEAADLYVDVDNAHVLVRDAPYRRLVVETKVRLDVPDEGCCFNFAQAGLLGYDDEDNYVKLTNSSIFNTRQTEFAKEVDPVPEGWFRYGNTVVGAPSEEWTYLRIVTDKLTEPQQGRAGGDTERYRAYTSQDGVSWVRGGAWTHSLGDDARIALAAFGLQTPGHDFTAEFDYVRVSTVRVSR